MLAGKFLLNSLSTLSPPLGFRGEVFAGTSRDAALFGGLPTRRGVDPPLLAAFLLNSTAVLLPTPLGVDLSGLECLLVDSELFPGEAVFPTVLSDFSLTATELPWFVGKGCGSETVL